MTLSIVSNDLLMKGPAGDGEPPERAATVLIVEDEVLAREALGELLEGEGYRVLCATRPSEALAFAQREGRIDVLVTDLGLPEMWGNTLAERILEQHPRVKVILMSASSEGPDPKTLFVRKPIELGLLLELIERTLADAHP